MAFIKHPMKSDKNDVMDILAEVKTITQSDNFNIETDFYLIRKSKPGEKNKYSTMDTLLELDYQAEDVVDRLAELTIEEYSETLFDRDDDNPPRLFVFGKVIHDQLVYIKLKIKGEPARKILCVSFHFAEYPMDFPYR